MNEWGEICEAAEVCRLRFHRHTPRFPRFLLLFTSSLSLSFLSSSEHFRRKCPCRSITCPCSCSLTEGDKDPHKQEHTHTNVAWGGLILLWTGRFWREGRRCLSAFSWVSLQLLHLPFQWNFSTGLLYWCPGLSCLSIPSKRLAGVWPPAVSKTFLTRTAALFPFQKTSSHERKLLLFLYGFDLETSGLQGSRDEEGRGREMHFPVSLLCANVCPCLSFSPSLHPWIGHKICWEEKGNVCFITNSVQRRNEWTHTRLTDWLKAVKGEAIYRENWEKSGSTDTRWRKEVQLTKFCYGKT